MHPKNKTHRLIACFCCLRESKIKIIILWQTTCYDIIMSCHHVAASYVSNKNLQLLSLCNVFRNEEIEQKLI